MKRRHKLSAALCVGLAILFAGVFYFRADDSAKRTAEATRRQMRAEGFKTDLTDFNFSTSPEMRAREGFLTNAATTIGKAALKESQRRSQIRQNIPNLMEIVNRDAAEVVPTQEIKYPTGEDYWEVLRGQLAPGAKLLDGACNVALSGPIQFNLDARRGVGMLLPHLGALKNLQHALGARVILDLHFTNRAAAWTNLLASTRLVTAWEPEPSDISHMVHYSCAQIAFNILWQAMQVGRWSDEQLATLEREWANVDFFKGIPETAAFARAGVVAACQEQRNEPLPPNTTSLASMIRSPRNSFYEVQGRLQLTRYRQYGTYEDENALLLHYRDREMQLRRAIRATTWQEMRELPGVLKPAVFQSNHPTALLAMINMQEIARVSAMRGFPFCGLAAQAEARRRLILTALTLERHKLKKGAYPKTLNADELKPASANALTDFMDGKPLRYRMTDDGKFVLYSIGLDCTDNRGVAENENEMLLRPGMPWKTGIQSNTDLVWPRPATDAEIDAEEKRREAESKRLEAERSSRFPDAAF